MVMSEQDEAAWQDGNRAAWLAVLQTALTNLGYDDAAAGAVAWVAEREQAVRALRRACAEFGDNDWAAGLHLADVVEKHLLNHLEADPADE